MSPPVRYRATVAYVGTAFHGWQIQKNASRTVQALLQEAFGLFERSRIRIEGASRTDAGVHADGQVIHFDLPRIREARAIRDGVNRRLPQDVRLLDVFEAEPEFHARFDARWKEYEYRWSRAAVVPPRDSPFVATISALADARRLREAAHPLRGEHDFGVFAVQRSEGSTVRSLQSVSIAEHGPEIRVLFRGDGFLRGMVRSICGVLADIARGRLPTERVSELLATGDRRLLAPKAPARGLTLVRVGYPE